jgi:hypothetical protein
MGSPLCCKARRNPLLYGLPGWKLSLSDYARCAFCAMPNQGA